MTELLDLKILKEKIKDFSSEREWEKFHSPKNISMALSVEASELMEVFQWLTEKESRTLEVEGESRDDLKKRIEEELADVLVYSIRLGDLLDIDIPSAIERKMKLNATKYPIEKSKGNSRKYTKF